MKDDLQVTTKPTEVIVVTIDTPKKHIDLKCEKHPEKCDSHRLGNGQKMKWRSRGKEEFTIYFEPGKTPFEKDVLTYPEATTDQVAIHNGTFKYTVRDDQDASNELDPEIVVDPPKPD